MRNPALQQHIEDLDAQAAAIRARRMMLDADYRKRWGAYLRGEITRAQVDQHETDGQWYERVKALHVCKSTDRW